MTESIKLVRRLIELAIEAYMNNDDGFAFELNALILMNRYNIPEDVAFGKEIESGSGNS